MWYAAIQSAADGSANLRLACAGSDGVGIAAASMASAGAGVASTSVVSSTGSVVSGFVSGSVSADAATSVMVAPLNAGMGTSDNSSQSAAVTVMRPSLSLVAEMMLTPTDTSMTPSAAKTNASSPRSVRLIFMLASIPSGVSILSVTMPTGFDASWYMKTRGALPSIGSDPGMNCTSVPSLTVAYWLYGTAIASMRRSPTVSPSAAVTVIRSVVKRIMQVPLVCFRLVH